jgi:hypothetical protein
MGNFQKYWSQNVGQDFIVLDFFVGGILCGRLMSPAHEIQSMREIRLLRGRLPRKGGWLTGMWYNWNTVESVFKHHKPKPKSTLTCEIYLNRTRSNVISSMVHLNPCFKWLSVSYLPFVGNFSFPRLVI